MSDLNNLLAKWRKNPVAFISEVLIDPEPASRSTCTCTRAGDDLVYRHAAAARSPLDPDEI